MVSTLEAEPGAESPAHRPRLISVWGKGGVGKSTIAAGIALLASSLGMRTALVSTDPFPSLLEVLGGGEPGRWQRVCGFDALVVTEELAAEWWKRELGDQVYTLFSALFDVDRDTLLEYLSLAPWVLEQYYMLIVSRVASGYDLVVWDTAGAGGGLLMLELEEKLYRHLRLAPRIYARLRLPARGVEEVVRNWLSLAEEVLSTLHSPAHQPVLVLDALSGAYQLRLLEVLERHGLRVKTLIVNRVVDHACCEELVGLARESHRILEEARRISRRRGMRLYTLPLYAEPPRSCEKLAVLARTLYEQGFKTN